MTNKRATPAKRFLLPFASKELRQLSGKPEPSLGRELAGLLVATDHDGAECEQAPLLADVSINGWQMHAGLLHYYGQCGCPTSDASDRESALVPLPTTMAELRSYYNAVTTLTCLLADRKHADATLAIECSNSSSSHDDDDSAATAEERPVHRFLLAARSGYFRAMLAVDGRYSESSEARFTLPDDCVPARALPFIVHYLYTDAGVAAPDTELALTLADWTAIWRAADFLDFPALQTVCDEGLCSLGADGPEAARAAGKLECRPDRRPIRRDTRAARQRTGQAGGVHGGWAAYSRGDRASSLRR
ncbi:hypothetical protein SYNPS1DRAFT_31530 [Syncephalis pseudoplumigaleata]|uniref:BTB domain-containing protein n=1 Tax=Syncephalis pseudoplumigaleata TaxID=1712513 RepID=A0A4P9YST9_9FUNG|nr:hypothetical protein SYNPS1DRAFT_31530 [Syncephalis pseudoplumigaleata]|eukprot:RKP22815.1 hypothetical protein SYNPS1DRAFT_31530 [Syncephalis pseudoplumigaleata]